MSDKETNTPATPTDCPREDDSAVRLTGRVKWFNNKAGYGFITVVSDTCGDERVGTDVFVHHSAVNVEKEQYRYLVQGEYVDFSWTVSNSKTHKYQAENVRGVKNGKLICETRNEVRAMQTPPDHDAPVDAAQHNVRRTDNRQHRPRANGPGPREGEEWMLVRRKRRNNNTNTNNDKRHYHNNDNNNNNDNVE